MNENIIHRNVNGLHVSLWRGINIWFVWPTGQNYPVAEGDTAEEAIGRLFEALDEWERERGAA